MWNRKRRPLLVSNNWPWTFSEFQNQNGFAQGYRILELRISAHSFTTILLRRKCFWQKFQKFKDILNCSRRKCFWQKFQKFKDILDCSRMIPIVSLQFVCGESLSHLKFNFYQLITATRCHLMREVTWNAPKGMWKLILSCDSIFWNAPK